MKDRIKEILKKQACTRKQIRKHLHLEKAKDTILKELLREMELDGDIYLTEDNDYILFPENFKVAKLQITKSRVPYIIIDKKQYAIGRENLNGALNYDTLVYNNETHKVEKILKREFSTIVCEVIEVNGVKQLKPYNIIGDLDVRIGSNDLKHLKEGDRITVDVSLEKCENYYEGDFIEKIGTKSEPDIELKSIAISNGFQTEFPEEALEQLKTIPTEVREEDIIGRLDLRDEEIFTIDGKDTKDMDDAISIKKLENGNYELGVHIADVSHYIKEGTPLEVEARERGFSAYLINSVIPMFPKEISNGICSLNPHVDRLTISCIMEINPDGEIVDYNIEQTVINSKMKMNYDDVNKVLKGNIPGEYTPFEKSLLTMQELSKILTIQKEERGYLRFASKEVKFYEDEYGNIIDIKTKEKGPAEELIENFMVIANNCIATHLGWIGYIPSIYRNHENPNFSKVTQAIEFIKALGYQIEQEKKYMALENNISVEDLKLSEDAEEKEKRVKIAGHRLNTAKNTSNTMVLQSILEQLSNREEFPILSTLLLRTMQRANYGTKNIGHYALELPFYTHFTSPIRRTPDLQVHYILKKYTTLDIENTNLKKLEKELAEICYHSSFKERQADNAENAANNLKMAEYMQNHIGEYYEGHVEDFDKTGIYILTLDQIPGKIDYETLDETYKYDAEKRLLRNEEGKPIMKIGHRLSMYVEDVNMEEKITKFKLDKNLTMEEKNNQKKLTI